MAQRAIPAAVQGRPYPTAAFIGAVSLSVIAVGYACALAVFAPSAGLRVVLADLLVAMMSAAIAALIARGRLVSRSALEATAAVLLAAAYSALLLELGSASARAGPLSAHCCLTLVVAAIAVRHHISVVVLMVAAPLAWWSTAGGIHTASFDAMSWLPTWVLTVAMAAAVHGLMATEWWTANDSLDRTERLARLDELTGLANRRELSARGRQLAALAQRSNETLWCAFVDIDAFKTLNDTCGHPQGDRVLVATARALEQVARTSDVVARWGGDEFVILGVGVPPDHLELESRILNVLRPMVSDLAGRWTPGITTGIATAIATDASRGAPDVDALIDRADAVMYQRRRAR